jgi:hypothetical protein
MIYFSNVSISPRRTNEMTSDEFRVSAKIYEFRPNVLLARQKWRLSARQKFRRVNDATINKLKQSYSLTIRRSDDLDPMIRQSDDPAIRWSGDPTIRWSDDLTISIRRSDSWSDDPATIRPRSDDPTSIRRSRSETLVFWCRRPCFEVDVNFMTSEPDLYKLKSGKGWRSAIGCPQGPLLPFRVQKA